MAYIPSKNNESGRSSARPGKRSLRPTFGKHPKTFVRSASASVKKPRWIPRTGATSTSQSFAGPSTSTSRQFGDMRASSPFPQKPPYRPNGPVLTRTPYVKRAYSTPNGKSRYGFLPKDNKKSAFVRKPFATHSPKVLPRFVMAKLPKTQLAKYPPKQAATSWGNVATWYDKYLANANTYHEKVILPNLLRLVDPQKEELVLDLASGQGFFTRSLAAVGAHLTGIDISAELIAIAKKKGLPAMPAHAGQEGETGIAYTVGSAEDLSAFRSEHFDKAVIVLAIQNIEHVQKVFGEAARVLKKNGSFHLVMNHPAFRIPKRSSWAYDEKEKVQFRRVDQYISESREAIDMHPGMKDSPQTVSFHRPLQYYVKALVKAGFVIDRFEEWISHKDSDSGPRAKAENRARKEIPLFLYMRARKL